MWQLDRLELKIAERKVILGTPLTPSGQLVSWISSWRALLCSTGRLTGRLENDSSSRVSAAKVDTELLSFVNKACDTGDAEVNAATDLDPAWF